MIKNQGVSLNKYFKREKSAKPAHKTELFHFHTRSSHLRVKEKTSSATGKVKYPCHRSQSDKNRKLSSKSRYSFKLSGNKPVNKTLRKLSQKKEHSTSSRVSCKNSKSSFKLAKEKKNKDFFGSKRNETRFKKLKKKSIKNPLNIMNRAIINLNNSRSSSENSMERIGNSKDNLTEPIKSEVRVATQKQFMMYQDPEKEQKFK